MMKRRDIGAVLRSCFVACVCLLLITPLLLIVPMSFSGGSYLSFPPTTLSLRWYSAVLSSPAWIQAGLISVTVAALTMACATCLGTSGAYYLVRARSRWTVPFQVLLLSPMMVPTMVIAIAIYRLWSQWGLTNSILGLAIAHTVLTTPLVVITVMASLRTADEVFERAAASLGANPWRVFWHITFPIVLPGILTGALFAFVTSFDEIVITMFIAGPETMTLTKRLWDGIRYEVDPSSAVVASLMMFIELLVFALMMTVRSGGARSARPA